jgi:hypothetical protein
MTTLKTLLLAAIAAAAFATPSLAQNFQGFGVPGYVTEGSRTTQDRPVMLKTHKVKHHREHAK